jgi:hypothetical protein
MHICRRRILDLDHEYFDAAEIVSIFTQTCLTPPRIEISPIKWNELKVFVGLRSVSSLAAGGLDTSSTSLHLTFLKRPQMYNIYADYDVTGA